MTAQTKPGNVIAIRDVLFIVLGILVTGFALNSFLVPNKFIDGGTTGISLLIAESTGLPLGLFILLTNIPFVIMAAIQVNKAFAVKMLVCIIALSVCLHFMPMLVISKNTLIVSVFGGFFLGLGIGLAMRADGVFDGIEVLALYTGKRSGFKITEIILAMNIVIFLIAAFRFGPESALYSILTYFIASRTIDYVVEGFEEYTGVTIISGQSEEIKEQLVMNMGRGITIYKGERGFLKSSFDVSQPTDIVFTVITRLEVRKLKDTVHAIDPKAFVFTSTIREAAGGVLKRRVGHH